MKNIQINSLESARLNEKIMDNIKGGASCACSCCYENHGGSSTYDNGMANHALGIPSKDGTYKILVKEDGTIVPMLP
ncbi:MAG: TIGR04149 family rSAM-modified RiPP [Bacteroidales bacterium]|nr:TIGR04149 family rSAM-modified RiPP [Bacteroidales bacterium]